MARARSSNDDAVLAALREAAAPLSAYQVLAALRDRGIQSPPVVYRALDRLEKAGHIHRIEQLNAYVVCCGHKHDEAMVLAVCTTCKRVEEWPAAEAVALIGAVAAARGFRASHRVIELRGTCAICAGDAAGAAVACDHGRDHDHACDHGDDHPRGHAGCVHRQPADDAPAG